MPGYAASARDTQTGGNSYRDSEAGDDDLQRGDGISRGVPEVLLHGPRVVLSGGQRVVISPAILRRGHGYDARTLRPWAFRGKVADRVGRIPSLMLCVPQGVSAQREGNAWTASWRDASTLLAYNFPGCASSEF